MGQNFFWSYPSNANTYLLSYLSKYTQWTTTTNPANYSITIPSTANFFVVCLAGIKPSWLTPPINRGGGTITFNGLNMQQVGTYSSTDGVEIWYLKNPPIGTFSLSIPNSTGMAIKMTSSFYKTSPDISLYGHNIFTGLGNTTSANLAIPENSKLLVLDSVTIMDNYPIVDGVSILSNTDSAINYGSQGGIQLYAVQYKIFDSLSQTNVSMGWVVNNPTHPWKQLIAVFKN